MKRNLLITVLFLITVSLFAQRKKKENETGVIVCSEFHITRPLRDIFAENPVDENKIYKKGESEDRENRKPQKFKYSVKDGLQYGNDPDGMQTKMGDVQNGRAPIQNWAGQSATGFRPMDPSGAAGTSDYVQMINSTTFRVYTKSTGAIRLTGTLGNLWSPATPNSGDPVVMYDKAADRWFLAQFGTTGNKIYIAISTSSDPTGSYYTYTFTSPQFPDYLKFSVWADGYYMTSNQGTQKVFCFNRAEMLAGNAASRSIYTTFSPPNGSGFFIPLPGDAGDGTLPTYGTPCPIFSYSDNNWGAGYSDAVNIYQMAVNWVPTTPTATITLAANVATAAFDATYDASWNDVSQPGTAQKLDGIGGVCMYRAQWKTWSGYNTIVLNWAVQISTTQRSIKWCELRQNQSTGVWSMYQEGIYTPDVDTRWMGSIAMDNNGSIGLAYMKSNSTSIYPGIYYSGRRSCDPLGTLPITEVQVIAGLGSQTGTNRVGDYSHTCLDPDGVTFWHTSEYMGASGVAKTQIFSYQITPCGNTAIVNIAQTSGTNPQCPGASATFTATPVNGGTTPTYQWQVNGTNVGTNSTTYTTTTLTNGQIVSCIMTSNLSGVTGNPATSNSITMTVNSVVTPSVSIAITTGSNPSCSGAAITFTATPVNGGSSPTYQWKVNGTNAGTNSATFTTSSLTNGQVVTCVMTSNQICLTTPTATSNGITMTITAVSNPTVTIAQTAGSNPQCGGLSATFTATATNAVSPSYQWKVDGTNVGTNSTTYTTSSLTNGQVVTCVVTSNVSCPVTLGTGTALNTTTSDLGAAYPSYYGNGRQQYLIRASELSALGFSSGNISALAFNVAGTTGNPATLNGYTIKLGTTASTVLTTTFLAPTFTTVYGPTNYTPTLNAWNTHSFIAPFSWNGSSNVLVDICFSNQVVGTVGYQTYQTSTAFVSTAYYQADGAGGAGACTQATATATGSVRPNMTITRGFSATSNGITMTISSSVAPAVSIGITSGTNPGCVGSSVTFTATPTNGGTPSYQWKVDGTNVGTNVDNYTTSTLTNGQIVTCVMTSSLSCAVPSSATSSGITMTVNPYVTPAVSIGITSGANPTCAGSSVTFTATPTNGGTPSYQWKIDGTNTGTNSANFTTTALTDGQIVSCVMTSTALCINSATATSNNITMSVIPSITTAVSIGITAGANPMCAGASVTFTATPTNGGTPSYQWKVNGTNAGTNSTTFTTTTLTNGQTVTCVMTSTVTCPNPASVTSNSIVMTVNPVLTPSVSIAITSGANPTCAGSSVTFTATPTNGGTPSYQWKVNGTNAGTNSATFTTSTLTNGQIVTCVMTSTATCASPTTATSTGITMTVNPVVTPAVSIGITSGANPTCSGSSVTFTATPTNGGTPSYQWKVNGTNAGTNSTTFTTTTLTNGQIVTCVMTSTATCASPTTATSTGITMTVNPLVTPSVSIGITSGTNPTCAGSSVTFTATPTNGGTPSYQWKVNGTNAGTNSTTFTTTTLTNGQIVTCVMTSTATCASPTTATSTGITMTVNPVVTPAVSVAITSGANPTCAGSSVTFTATPTNGGTPSYQWKVNGTNAGTNSTTFTTTTLTNGQIVTCVMTSTATCASPTTATSTGITMTVNPVVTPAVSIAITSGANPTCAGSSVTFTATPTNGGTPSYQWKVNGTNAGTNSATFTTSTLTNGQIVTCVMTSTATCASPATATSPGITMTVNPAVTPSVSIGITTGTNPACVGSSVTFTATPTNGGTPTYQWKVDGTNAGTNSTTFTSSTLTNSQVVTCVMTSDATCASPATATSTGITMTINPVLRPAVSIGITSGSNPGCAGSSVTFTATPTDGGTPSYQWMVDGSNAGTNSDEFTTTSLTDGQVVTCEMTSNATCASPTTATSTGITITINPTVTPSVSIGITTGSNPMCAGSSVTFTATPTNGGTPSYQWKVDGTNAGTNSDKLTTTSLTDGQVVTCEMTSDATCASPSTATSTGITMTVNAIVTPSVSIGITSGTNPACSGSSVTFTATPTNGGTPSYQWQVNGTNAGTNSSTFSSSALSDGDIVTCSMTADGVCLTGNPAASNSITMDVYTSPSISSFTPLTDVQGAIVTISGSGFTGATSVKFNGITSSFTIDNDNQVTATVPAGSTTGLISVTNICGTAYSSVNFTLINSVALDVTMFIEGFYADLGQMRGVSAITVCDTIDVCLASATSPYNILYTIKTPISLTGGVSVNFPAGISGNSYYIVIKHRNSLETWSASPVLFSASNSYDFSSGASQAYGSNLVDQNGKYAIISGDVNQDGVVDLTDLQLIENAASLFMSGYVREDITGDGLIESGDYSLVENNLTRTIKKP